MADDPKEKKTDKTSEQEENSEALKSKEESKSEVKEVSEKEETTEEVEEEKEEKEEEVEEEEVEEEEEEEKTTSVIDELLETAKGDKKEEVKEEAEKEPATKGIDRSEIDIARAVYPKLDPTSTEYDRDFEEQVVKEYIYGWAKAGGKEGPTYREAAALVSAGVKEADKAEKVDKKKEEATTETKTTPGSQAEASITKEKEGKLLDAIKRGNRGAIVELLKARRKKVEES